MTWPFVRRHREGAKPGRADRLAVLATLLVAPLGPMALAGTAGATPSGLTTYPSTGIFAPASITTGPRRGAVVHQRRERDDRTHHHRRGDLELLRSRHPYVRRARRGDHHRPRRGAVVHQRGQQRAPSIGRITTAGTVTTFSNNVYDPQAITTGPDGNLWEADYLGTTDQTTTSGTTTRYDGIYPEEGITTGPDGNLWVTSPGQGGGAGAVGKVTPGGTLTEIRRRRHWFPAWDHGRPRRGALGGRPGPDRPGHHRGHRHHLQ